MANNLYVAWQDDSRSWHTIGRLSRLDNGYEFVFTKGASVLGAIPKDLFGMDIYRTYRLDELLPLFKNKLPSRSRPDFERMSDWLNLTGKENEFDLLSKFGLIPGTDSTLIYPEPELVAGRYSVEFYVHGIRHMHEAAVTWCAEALPGARLLPLLDVQNPVDASATALRPSDNSFLLGYVPSFYSADFHQLLSDYRCAEAARLSVVKINLFAPPQLRILCKFQSPVPRNFVVLNTDEHRPIEAPRRRKFI